MNNLQKKRTLNWAKVLESDKYMQGIGKLHPVDTYCCLGVACDIYRKTTKHGKWNSHNAFVLGRKIQSFTLLPPVMQYFGIDGNITKKLTRMNDVGHFTFGTIAKYLRKLVATS